MTHHIYPYMVREGVRTGRSSWGWRCSCGAQHKTLTYSRGDAAAAGAVDSLNRHTDQEAT